MTRIAFGMMRLPLFDEEDQTSVDFKNTWTGWSSSVWKKE